MRVKWISGVLHVSEWVGWSEKSYLIVVFSSTFLAICRFLFHLACTKQARVGLQGL